MSTPPRYPLSPLALGLALAAALLATVPAAATALVPDGPLVEVGSIGPGYTPTQLAPLAAQQPRVVMDGAGNFFVFWWQADQSLAEPRLMSSKFDAAGEPMLQVSEFWDPVDGIGPIRGMDDVAISAAGDLVVAWSEPGGIFLRGFDNCRLSLGPIVAVGTGEPEVGHDAVDVERVAVGIADDRTIVVAWVQTVEALAAGGAGAGNPDEVWVERFGVDGSQLAPAVRVADHAEILGLDLEVAADGSFGVAVETREQGESASTVDLALFDAAGQPMAVPPLAGDHPSIGSPQVAASGLGTFLLAYAGSGGGACAGIFARAHGADGSPVGFEKRIDAPATGCQRRPAAAGMDDGWAVAWAGADADPASAADAAGYGIWVQPVRATGLVLDGAVRVLPGWAHFDLAARGQWTAVAAVLADGPKDVPRVVVRRLGPPEAVACAHGSTDDHLCLQGDRFRVDADWRDPYNTTVGLGSGFDVADVQDSGAFWFFKESNLELLVKVLDGRGANGHWWVFSGALSTVEYWIAVTDLVTGQQRVYHNPPFTQASIADAAAFDAFPPEGEAASAAPQLLAGGPVAGGVLAVPAGELGGSVRETAPLTPVPCGGGNTRLCLNGDLFGAYVDWTNPRTGVSGKGQVIPMTGDTGGFWFFDEDNVELMVKVLDGRRVNGHWWVFYAGLSDVEYTLTVTSPFGEPVTYTNPAFEVTSGADTAAVEED